MIQKQNQDKEITTISPLEEVDPISQDDHVRGDKNAPVTIVEYSDFECPFCKSYHNTLNLIMEDYEAEGAVKWVYRHSPIEGLHPLATTEAIASECVTELGGKDAFWQFADRFFELTPSNNQTDLETVFPQITQELGLDHDKFEECLASGKDDKRITRDKNSFRKAGGQGTPWSIIIGPNGDKYPVNGAQAYSSIKQIIELLLSENE